MSLHQRRDVLEKLAALFGTASVAGLPFREENGEILTGVVDRIVDDLAVVLLEDDGELVDQTTLPVDELPGPAKEEGTVLELVMDGDDVDRVRYDKPETERRREEAEDRFDELAD
ncbi:DUF3006 family protein [Natranaeroarchaeum sulfidigenes]|uniref:DUF3006 domain-containing protein n=1 Tax=Natranaeroarchaeum sulfidigenes TaxID=2784880 RepID=A0A897MUN1_9EURY|nr:DUF3006 family protein [Natranaeroarchaeum sulfidigenes]QSG02753.1 Uncharacterized protein AArcS_1541 [Natranaeroarchaeum sulfidigenes]